MTEDVGVVVVGAGQAGLSLSYELSHAGVEHLILERDRVGASWRGRWDSFCLVTPNWTVQLPGGRYEGDDENGFMPRDEVVAHLVRYADSFRAPVREGVDVLGLDPGDDDRLLLRTSSGDIRASHVIVATGAYQRPHRPRGVEGLQASLQIIDADEYSNPGALPPGKVLVVGSGQTGCQLAEDLFEGGPPGLPCMRARTLVAPPDRGSRRRRVARRDAVLGSDAGRSPEPGGAADSQRADHRPRRRPRSALQDPPGNWSHSVGSLRGRRGWCCVLRVRPRGLRGIRRRA